MNVSDCGHQIRWDSTNAMSCPGPLFAPSDGSVWCNLSSRRVSQYPLPEVGLAMSARYPRRSESYCCSRVVPGSSRRIACDRRLLAIELSHEQISGASTNAEYFAATS